jgi:hypothetical protein
LKTDVNALYTYAVDLEKPRRCVFVIRPDDFKRMTPEQEQFVKALKEAGREVYQTGSAEKIVEYLASPPSEMRNRQRGVLGTRQRIFIICDSATEEKLNAVELVVRDLQRRAEDLTVSPTPSFEPILPATSLLSPSNPDAALKTCDGVLIYWDKNSTEWFRANHQILNDTREIGNAQYRSLAIFDKNPTDQGRHKLIQDMNEQDRVIGRPAEGAAIGEPAHSNFDTPKLVSFLRELGFTVIGGSE